MQEKKRFHYGYLILFCCCMYMFVGMGVLHHALGQFLNPVTTDMGFSVGQFTFYLTFLGYTQVIVLLFARKLVERFDLRPVLMVASVVFVCGYVVVANAKSIYYWYVAGVMWGASAAFLAPLPVAILINRWFKKNNGAMIGFAMIFSSIAGTILSPLMNVVIAKAGWRTGYWTFAGIATVLMVLPTFLILRNWPGDMGLEPVGADEAGPDDKGEGKKKEEWGYTLKEAMKSPAMWLLMLMAMLMTQGGNFMQFFTAYFQNNEITALAAMAASIGMVSGVLFKVPMGVVADKAGAYTVVVIGSVSAILAFLCASFMPGSPLMYLGLVLYGIALSLSMITLPIYVRQTFGTKYYGDIWSIIVLCFNLMGCMGQTAIGFIYDVTGGYVGSMVIEIVVYIALIICGGLQLVAGKRLRKESRAGA